MPGRIEASLTANPSPVSSEICDVAGMVRMGKDLYFFVDAAGGGNRRDVRSLRNLDICCLRAESEGSGAGMEESPQSSPHWQRLRRRLIGGRPVRE